MNTFQKSGIAPKSIGTQPHWIVLHDKFDQLSVHLATEDGGFHYGEYFGENNKQNMTEALRLYKRRCITYGVDNNISK